MTCKAKADLYDPLDSDVQNFRSVPQADLLLCCDGTIRSESPCALSPVTCIKPSL